MTDLYGLAARLIRVLEPETAHQATIKGLKAGAKFRLGPRDLSKADPILATRLCGLELASPVGLAAGFDKNAEVPLAMLRAGFGFVECGTVTPRPQAGNPRPRLFRLDADLAVINRMGFNNEGLDAFTARLAQLPSQRSGPIGANIGANKDAPDRLADYATGLKSVFGLCDYVTVNISSPNTPGLRALQSKDALAELAGRLAEVRAERRAATGRNPPLFVKVAPDLAEDEILALTETALAFSIDGLIVSNTTLARPNTLRSDQRGEAGGLSGAPLMAPSTRVLASFHAAAQGRLALIGAGGIASGADAYAKILAGASAVQLYSALVYEGPGLAPRVARDLAARLRADGFASVSEAVGAG